ncbi:ribosomal protein S20 [Dysgonomonas sp. PFB1-18]|uniref:ATP-binding protein n=1 Tax=unclassified Dysgonomonas TaxID=2630389 RepID=UPI002473D0B7|nr:MULTISPECIES: ATP-binding protein [unclassified Dysgonomonas]MDH6309432.1 ribosomal protein S20 [Dysgonomonas sp. PF1-14]MDH6339703.1 ribosomal protein S20 [Dysgonomonas sp. PF1-16]MDH6381351.1 ribosomal protein S20 [Dysgonomonas sp. PFB1-18]MDH6398566.1 ribosomal protein S20 [Dysgonomonas sp. PF1-23]
MKLSKFDIGAEVISILTKGMYPDPKDTLREYIQNGVDAKSKKIILKIRQDSVTIQDNGIGMNHDVLRKAVRIGVSDKNPTKNVGFMGIGIYSAFHLCERLVIFSRGSLGIPNRLEMDFQGMKDVLLKQKELRLKGEITSEQLMDLQTLLQNFVSLSEDGDLSSSDFPVQGTRVELVGISPYFYNEISEFKEVAQYLRDVVPLRFDHVNFKWGKLIEDKITKICEEHNSKFELIDLDLQINSQLESLYKPYKNSDFDKAGNPQSPEFRELKQGTAFFGVAWGCLSSDRKKIINKDLRGFLIRKQGFAIGKRESIVNYFPRANTFFDRYIGEIIIVNTDILPNASRNDIEYSALRTSFYNSLTEVAKQYDEIAEKFQNDEKADEVLAEMAEKIKKLNLEVSQNQQNSSLLLMNNVEIKGVIKTLFDRIKTKRLKEGTFDSAKALLKQAEDIDKIIRDNIKIANTGKRKKNAKTSNKVTTVDIARNLSNIELSPLPQNKNYESLINLLVDLELNIDNNQERLFSIIDEMFIQALAENKQNYYELLNDLLKEYQRQED